MTTILYLWKKWKEDQAQKHVILILLPKNRNTQSNPNIGNDGRNINIVGTTGNILIVSLMMLFILIHIMYASGLEIGAFIEKMNVRLLLSKEYYEISYIYQKRKDFGLVSFGSFKSLIKA